MRGRSGKLGIFFVVLVICLLLLVISQFSFFAPLRGAVEEGFISINHLVRGGEDIDSSAIEKLQQENQKLKTKLAKEYLLLQENQAFRDQYAKSESQAKSLLPAKVLSHRDSGTILVDQGAYDGVKKGQAVIQNDNLLGIVTSVTPHIATIQLSIAKNFSVTTQTVKTNALGVSKGQGDDGIIFQNVLLSDTLEVGDFVATKGDMDDNGSGLPPDLLVGKIISIDKKASALYQTAKVESLVNFSKIRTVFILRN